MLLLCALLPAAAFTQDAPKNAHLVRALGEATVTAKPDRAEISISIGTQAPTAQAAAAQNAADTTQVLDSLKRVLGSGGQVKTSGYSVGPDYQFSKNGAPRKVSGYHAANRLSVTVDELPLVGKVIDVASQSGATTIGGLSFTLRNDDAVRAQALAEAATKARSAAEAIAKALDLHVTGILEATSTDAAPVAPMPRFGSVAESVEVQTPIEAATIEIHASVIVTLEVR